MEEVVGNIWDNLSRLSEEDPQKYHELIEQSAKEHKLRQSQPEPHKCISVQTESKTELIVNIFSWDRVRAADRSSLPLCGGELLTGDVVSVAANPKDLQTDVWENVMEIILSFVEHRNPGLKLKRKYKTLNEAFRGNLEEIWRYLAYGKEKTKNDQLVTETTDSLLNLALNKNKDSSSAPNKIELLSRNESSTKSNLIQEVKPGEKDSFEDNFKFNFAKENNEKAKKSSKAKDIKIKSEQINLKKELSTQFCRRIPVRKPIFGRKVTKNVQGAFLVTIKFYLFEAHHPLDVSIAVYQNQISIQTSKKISMTIPIVEDARLRKLNFQMIENKLQDKVLTVTLMQEGN